MDDSLAKDGITFVVARLDSSSILCELLYFYVDSYIQISKAKHTDNIIIVIYHPSNSLNNYFMTEQVSESFFSHVHGNRFNYINKSSHG